MATVYDEDKRAIVGKCVPMNKVQFILSLSLSLHLSFWVRNESSEQGSGGETIRKEEGSSLLTLVVVRRGWMERDRGEERAASRRLHLAELAISPSFRGGRGPASSHLPSSPPLNLKRPEEGEELSRALIAFFSSWPPTRFSSFVI